MHEDLVTYGFGVEELARLGIRGAHQTGEQIRLLPDRTRVHAGAHERVCRPEQLRVVTAVTLPAHAPRPETSSAYRSIQVRASTGWSSGIADHAATSLRACSFISGNCVRWFNGAYHGSITRLI